MASSTKAAQFIKAKTRIVWRVAGRKTSLRLVQWTKVNSEISSIMASGGWKLTQGDLSKVDAPLEEVLPEIGFTIDTFTAPSDAHTRCKEQHSAKAL